MRTSQDGIDLIITRYPGCRLFSYRSSNDKWMIGYDHTDGVYEGMVTTFAQAETWLRDDLRPFEEAVESMVQVPLRQNQFDALVVFAYDVGSDVLRHADLLAFLNAYQYNHAADAFLEHGNEVHDHRRAVERALFIAPPIHGMWQKFLAWMRR